MPPVSRSSLRPDLQRTPVHSSEAPAVRPMQRQSVAELEQLLRINEHKLEICCRDQPVLFYQVSTALTRAQSARDQAAQDLKDAEARADAEIRAEPVPEGEKKPTETAIGGRVRMHASVVRAREALREASEAYGSLSALKESFGQRSYMLRELVALWLANYYGEIEASGSSGEMSRLRGAEVKDRQAEARRRRE